MSSPNKYQTNKQFPTPLVGDILLYETRDSRAAPSSIIPPYGSPHWDINKWPHHELVYVSGIDKEGNQSWVWAAIRDYQFLYNFEITYPYGGLRIGLNGFPRYTRSYVIKRDEYTPIVNGTLDPIHDGIQNPLENPAVLISEVETRIGIQELDSLYVAVNRTYETIPAASDQIGFGYQVSYPFQDDAYPRLTWRFTIARALYTPAAELSLCPIIQWATLKLVEQPEATSSLEENQLIVVTRVYDTLPGPPIVKDRLETDCKPPPQFVHLAEVTATTTRLEAPTAVPDTPTGFVQSSEIIPDGKATANKINTTYNPLVVNSLTGSDIDPETGKSFAYTTSSVAAGTVSTLAVDSNGVGIIVRPYNTCFSIQTVRKIVGLAGNSRTYQKLYNYYWPRIITQLFLNPIYDNDGNIVKVIQWADGFDAYKGPCIATVTDSWSLAAPAVVVPVQMFTKPMQWDFIFSNGNYEPSLHPSILVYETTGTTHPTYAFVVNQKNFIATNYTTWPNSVIAVDEVTPHYGGYLRTVIQVFSPTPVAASP